LIPLDKIIVKENSVTFASGVPTNPPSPSLKRILIRARTFSVHADETLSSGGLDLTIVADRFICDGKISTTPLTISDRPGQAGGNLRIYAIDSDLAPTAVLETSGSNGGAMSINPARIATASEAQELRVAIKSEFVEMVPMNTSGAPVTYDSSNANQVKLMSDNLVGHFKGHIPEDIQGSGIFSVRVVSRELFKVSKGEPILKVGALKYSTPLLGGAPGSFEFITGHEKRGGYRVLRDRGSDSSSPLFEKLIVPESEKYFQLFEIQAWTPIYYRHYGVSISRPHMITTSDRLETIVGKEGPQMTAVQDEGKKYAFKVIRDPEAAVTLTEHPFSKLWQDYHGTAHSEVSAKEASKVVQALGLPNIEKFIEAESVLY
jgi:hypothetical protein